jgi:DNA polymerase III subunit beta
MATQTVPVTPVTLPPVLPTAVPKEPAKEIGPPPAQPFAMTLDRFALLRELNLAAWCVDKSPTIPVLAAVLIDAHKKSLTLQSTDLEIGFAGTVSITTLDGNGGRVAIGAHKLLAVLNSLEAESVTLKFNGPKQFAELSAGHTRFELPTYEIANFPVLPPVPKWERDLPAAPFTQAIRLTRFAVSQEESRYTLQAALLVCEPQRLLMSRPTATGCRCTSIL